MVAVWQAPLAQKPATVCTLMSVVTQGVPSGSKVGAVQRPWSQPTEATQGLAVTLQRGQEAGRRGGGGREGGKNGHRHRFRGRGQGSRQDEDGVVEGRGQVGRKDEER